MERSNDEFSISTDPARLDLNLIHGFLTRSYWSKGIPRETVARAIENSLCFGVYEKNHQVGFARAITDYATFACIADVFVLEGYVYRPCASAAARLQAPASQTLQLWMQDDDRHQPFR